MLKLTLTTALLTGVSLATYAQDEPHRFEVGLEVVNYSPFAKQVYNYASNQLNDKAHWASGAVFRYNLGRFSLRSGVSYNTGTNNTEPNNCADCAVGSSTGKDLRLRLGGQYSPLVKAPWLYVFSDFYYRRFTSEGRFTGGFCGCLDTDVEVTSDGVGNSTGLGVKIRTWKHFYLNPEVYYDVLRAPNHVSSADRNSGNHFQYDTRTKQQAPAIRVNAIIAF
ncbi:outer membrane beta-barrel protein [Hymenobacter chitinivorans]|uniref:Outer membrane protein with beta-barrel domain n=1 Tax=Hymenobacter chitinivorans DSM 11115 TaxID=1121954 RepID=A0A2M9BA76_9BACT|nr:outer membrane beta-barrel protein [Hymenobacter chitinivorans]PJJ54848.1 outer membrane protein with beta-barrel domain [Hymenobacter chitinivorans DSM 11115]